MAVSSRILLLLLHMFLLPCIVRCSSLYAAHHQEDPLLYDEEEDFITSSEAVEKQHTSTSNCSRCSENRERREHRLQSIRIQILNQLGMREAPNITDKNLPHIPPLNHLLDRYSMQADAPHFVPGPEYGDEDDFYIAAEKVLAFAHTPPMLIEVENGDQHLYFKLSSNLQNSQIQSAHLWIYLRPTRHTLHRNVTLYQVDRQFDFGELDFLQVLPYDRPKKIIRETEYQEEYRNGDILNGVNLLKKRFIPAGLPSKGKPEYEPEEYDSSDGILPDFRGKSTVKSAYVPQPNLQKLSSCKPPSVTKSPFLLQPHMTEVQPYSHSVYCPMPRELVLQTAPTKPLWNVDNLKPLVCGTRYDLTSSYQADYCGTQTQPRKICLEKKSEGKLANTDFTKSHKEYSSQQNPKCKANKDETQQWNYAHSLLFRTTYNTDYLPPSTHGLICHSTMYHPDEK